VFDENRDRASLIVRILEQSPPWADSRTVRVFHDLDGDLALASASQPLRKELPGLAIVVEADASKPSFPGLVELNRQLGVPTLLVIDPSGDPTALAARVRMANGWMALEAVERELCGRVASVLDGHKSTTQHVGQFPATDPRFLALVIHDLRTPLNVITLTIRAITLTMPERSAELDEDLTFLKENAGQLEKMLKLLGDYCRLVEGESEVSGMEFDPRRFLSDFLEKDRSKLGADALPIRLELADSSPMEVSLDQKFVEMALHNALANALNAARETRESKELPVKLRSSGRGDRWILELIVDKPPAPNVVSTPLSPDLIERLSGSHPERRGLDLAVVAHISKLFGGTARLAVEPDRRSTIILDWPQRLPGN
jgi:signal transduction histidine kinase